MRKTKATSFKVIELFSGCGGMALGLEKAGLETVLLVENNVDCVKTLKLNRPEWNVLAEDIAIVDFQEYEGIVDIVAGGFPCQAFSHAGQGKGFADTRGTLFFEFLRCLNEVRPKIAVAENVRGLLTHDKGRTLIVMMEALQQSGYKVVCKLLKAQFLDVPQKRERLFIIAIREDLNIQPIFPEERSCVVPLKDALRDCPESPGIEYSEKKKRVMAMIPAGGNWKSLPVDVQKEYMKGSFSQGGGKTGMARRLSWEEPCLTLLCSPSQNQTERCHPGETRPLRIREYARIQTFPDEWQFAGGVTSQYRQIGNAVPVNLAYHLGRCLVEMLGKA